MDRITTFSLAALLFLLSPGASSQAATDTAYARAIADAAVIEAQEIVPLPVIDSERVRVVTWTNFADSYEVGKTTQLSWGETWVTLDGAVQQHCQKMAAANLMTDLQKLLGLPLAEDKGRSFVTLEVSSQDIFRPCANPSVSQTRCGTRFPGWVGEKHRAWYAAQSANAYQAPNGYPWTRLGYTFNWKQGESEVGPAEFVILKGAQAKTLAVSDTQRYCTP